jgi:hypothetical protein
MILAHYQLDASKVNQILERFHAKFKRRRAFKGKPIPKQNPNPNPKKIDMNTIKIIDIYKRTCKYANETEIETKTNLVIKIQYYPNKEYYILNILYEDYKDLL